MSREAGRRRLYPVAVEPSASDLFAAVSQAGNNKSANHHAHDETRSREALPRYVALNFNFKPDSTHDCKQGALFQPDSNRNVNADWQLELESTETESEPGPSTVSDGNSASRKPAHVFTGPQTVVKSYDLVLVWDREAKVYRLDRIASAFSLKYERSKTVLSAQSHDVWKNGTAKAKKRALVEDRKPRQATAETRGTSKRYDTSVDQGRGSRSAEVSASTPTKPLGELKLKSKASTVMAPVRRSSRRSLAVEMEEFADRSESPVGSPSAPSAARSTKRSSVSKDSDLRGKEESKKVKVQESNKERGSSDETASALRRSRRRSSQAQVDESEPSSQRSHAAAVASKGDGAEGDDDDLALQLERELERELEVEMHDLNESKDASPSSTAPAPASTKATSGRSLSPVSRLKRGDGAGKISTPKAHTPDLDEASAYPSSYVSKSFKRSTSPNLNRVAGAGQVPSSAFIGLGLQQTGVGITPKASPRLDIASPIESSKSPLALERSGDGNEEEEEEEEEEKDEDEEDDDLQDFAAELDMSLAEGLESVPAAAAPALGEKRRSSRSQIASQSGADSRPRQVRKAYGLGGPRQEEEELEDSD
ncbi:hypothetical protein EX895_003912 [Sporisorium graminicola]|uniref:Transcription elongation factor Eaf N-terminal domain-containing protein n=1 Tax=Sporisorium graminicola TaxID=280036 RepID=A0A4U7KRQ6_9BASI|nr:hypothetical protein EX895_003912 [Sporisorium graminicola]TKY87235.1 hypothetical protein EX895_003912 [Sporisorium graminicola]